MTKPQDECHACHQKKEVARLEEDVKRLTLALSQSEQWKNSFYKFLEWIESENIDYILEKATIIKDHTITIRKRIAEDSND